MVSNYYDSPEKIYTFISPVKTIFGINSLRQLISELEKFEQNKIFLITNKIIKDTNPVKNIISGLMSNNFDLKIFESEVHEPTVGMVKDFIKFIRSEKEGIVIGIGGGSIMDQAKVASVLATNNGEIEQYAGADKIQNEGLPLILIPTTAGTGAETSKNAVLMKEGKKLVISSSKILPTLSIIDPVLSLSLPPRPTAYTGMDALCHAIEGIMSLNCSPVVMPIALEVISIVNENLPIAYFDGTNIQARFKMCIAATLGGLSLNAGVVLGHSICYTLERFGIPHGLGCAISLPYIIKFNSPVIPNQLKRIAGAFGLKDDKFGSTVQTTSYVIDAIKHLNNMFEIPLSINSFVPDEKVVNELADECFNNFPRPNNPRKYSKKDIASIYEQMWSGNLDII